jgi:hypothetical protein
MIWSMVEATKGGLHTNSFGRDCSAASCSTPATGIQTMYTLLSISCKVSAKFDTCTVVGINGTLVEDKMFTFAQECTHFIFTKSPI